MAGSWRISVRMRSAARLRSAIHCRDWEKQNNTHSQNVIYNFNSETPASPDAAADLCTRGAPDVQTWGIEARATTISSPRFSWVM